MPSPIVDIDVGGKVFRSSLASLSRAPFFEHLLRHIHEGAFAAQRTGDGHFFIDRSPELFQHVLDVLRSDGDTDLSVSSQKEAARLVREFEYYGLEASLSEEYEEQAVLSARFQSGNLKLHVSAPSSLYLEELQEQIEDKTLPSGASFEFIGLSTSQVQFAYVCSSDNVDASDIPVYLSDVADKFVDIGFVESCRSESSSFSFAPKHWVESEARGLENIGVDGDDIEAMVHRSVMKHWVSETVIYTRHRGPVIHVKSPKAYFSDGSNQPSEFAVQTQSDMGYNAAYPSLPPESASGPSHDGTDNLAFGHVTSLQVLDELVHEEPAAVIDQEEASHTVEELWASGVGSTLAAASSGSRRIVVLNFSRMGYELEKAILGSALASALLTQGVDLQPAWAGGAKVLLEGVDPCDSQVRLSEGPLRFHHVLLHEEEEPRLMEALQHLPYRVRKLKPPRHRITPSRQEMPSLEVSSDENTSDSGDNEHLHTDADTVSYRVMHTFIHFPIEDRTAETRTVATW